MIRLDQRLGAAFEMLRGADSVADIGCDHGKLTAALLLEGKCSRVIAADISPDCLKKTEQIIRRYGLQDRAQVRLGSGLTVLSPGECAAAAILGMGGELIAELLMASPDVVKGMEKLVLQPMSGIEELRQWLYENSYHTVSDRIVCVGQRWYQLISVKKTEVTDLWPPGFPKDCWLVGYRSFTDRDPMLRPCCRELLDKRSTQLQRAAGTAGERKLAREAKQLEEIIEETGKWI